MGSEQDFTSGSIDRAIFLLSVPMILEMVMESLFAVVDAFFVNRVSVDAVATVGLTESVLMLIYSLAMGLGMAATTLVARRVGEKNYTAASEAGLQVIYIGLIISVIISIIGIFYSDDILGLMGASSQVIQTGSGFTRWMLIGNASIMMLFINNGIFRGAGNASIAMRVLVVSNILNIVLDPILIFGLGPIPAYGVQGAGMATTIGRSCGVLLQFYFMFKGTGIINLTPIAKRFQAAIVGKVLWLAAGTTGQFLIASASWVFLVRILSKFGSEALAGYTNGMRIIMFAILPAWGLSNAAATLVGQNLGAQKPDRAERSVWRTGFLNMIFLGAISIVFWVFSEPIVRLFSQEPAVIAYSVECLRYVCLGYVFYAYGMVIIQSFNGAGDILTPMLMNIFGFWLIQIPLAYTLAIILEMGPTGVFVAITVVESMLAVIGIILFRKGWWKKDKSVKKEKAPIGAFFHIRNG